MDILIPMTSWPFLMAWIPNKRSLHNIEHRNSYISSRESIQYWKSDTSALWLE